MRPIVNQGPDQGFAVRRDGTILLRTASDTDWQAMANGLCLVFGYDAYSIDWKKPDEIRFAWESCLRQSDGSEGALEIVEVRAVPCKLKREPKRYVPRPNAVLMLAREARAAKAAEMEKLIAGGASLSEVADKFGITKQRVAQILKVEGKS